MTNPDVEELQRYNRELWCGHVRAHLNIDGSCARCKENRSRDDFFTRLQNSLHTKIDWANIGFEVKE